MNRGIERRQIFNDDADRNRFLLLLGELEEDCGYWGRVSRFEILRLARKTGN